MKGWYGDKLRHKLASKGIVSLEHEFKQDEFVDWFNNYMNIVITLMAQPNIKNKTRQNMMINTWDNLEEMGLSQDAIKIIINEMINQVNIYREYHKLEKEWSDKNFGDKRAFISNNELFTYYQNEKQKFEDEYFDKIVPINERIAKKLLEIGG